MAKQPKVKQSVNVEKTPKTVADRIPESPEKLTWSFSMLDVDGPYGWSRCDSHRDYFDILRRKKSFEGMTWAELGKGGSHHIDLKDLCKDAQNRLRALNLDDFDELYSLRITGKKRVWCFKDGRIMRVIWWDPDHQVCPVSKRHT